MSQKQIEVELRETDENTDVLVFHFDSGDKEINLNSDSSQKDIKDVFIELLKSMFDNEVELKLVCSDGYSRKMYMEVCEEYMSHL